MSKPARITDEDGYTLVTLPFRISLENIEAFLAQMNSLSNDTSVAVNFSNCFMCCSGGIGALILRHLALQKAGHKLAIFGLCPGIQDKFHTLQLQRMLHLFQTKEQAEAFLSE